MEDGAVRSSRPEFAGLSGGLAQMMNDHQIINNQAKMMQPSKY